VVLSVPATEGAALTAELQPLLGELAAQAGMHFETRQEIVPTDLQTENVRLAVIAGLDDASLSALAASAPATQFLLIGSTGLQPSANLSILSASVQRPDVQAFLAGYIAAGVTKDWRVAVVSEAGTAPGKAARWGFTNGVDFFCGLCQPVYPPFPIPSYPLVWELAAGASQGEWDAALAYFKEWQVQTVYLAGTVASDEALSAFAGAGFNLISDRIPPTGLQERWICSIGASAPGEALKTIWPDLISWKGGAKVDLPLAFTHINQAVFSPGRQQYVNEMLADLLAGFIDTGVDPVTGEKR